MEIQKTTEQLEKEYAEYLKQDLEDCICEGRPCNRRCEVCYEYDFRCIKGS